MTELLVADDEAVDLVLISDLLEGRDFHVELAVDGAQAWMLLDADPERFDTLILDRFMPRMDGLELLLKLKRDPRFEDLPVIMQTAAASPDEVEEGLVAGAWYYLAKPYRIEALGRIVDTALRERQNRLELRRLRAEHSAVWEMVHQGVFRFRDIRQARLLSAQLAVFTPKPSHVSMGLTELMINAVEHGNLGVGYDEKTRLLDEGIWLQELDRRLALPSNQDRFVQITVLREPGRLVFTVQDQGAGFEWGDYLELDAERAFDSHGRGIAMARQLAFSSLDYLGAGNEVRAVVELD